MVEPQDAAGGGTAWILPPGLPRAALVTGAGVRLGRAIALALADAGFAIGLHCRDSVRPAESLRREIEEKGGRAVILRADLAAEAETEQLVDRATAALGPLGILVNNASAFERDEWHDADRDSWDRHLEPNLRAPFVLMQRFARQLPDTLPDGTRAEGVVLNMLDQRVWSLTPHFVSYTVSKSALWTLTRSMALALAPRIRVNGIGPGPAIRSARQTPEQFERQCASTPLGRGTDPDEVARAAMLLLSLPSVTGQMLALDGGQHLQWHAAPAGGQDEAVE
ncbi:SDR family oxidoreductase [Rhizosaccharibacter radicis]|uniref:SDR family oxidoreductase n=1 Tax=Rhizosaccharibacter radicis TaxID=2782605 RepID=A0ABT1VXS9_9PROT|nr:SDR family oxidoreductase [Acetobacteraceae bacterium KSS12]